LNFGLTGRERTPPTTKIHNIDHLSATAGGERKKVPVASEGKTMLPSRRRSVNPIAMRLVLGLAVLEIVASWSPAFVSHSHRRTKQPALPRPVGGVAVPPMWLFSSASSSSSSEHQDDSSAPMEQPDGNATDSMLSRVNKKVRVAKAQSEIDRILAGPDAPFDAETELKKVVSIAASPVTTTPLDDMIGNVNGDDEKEEENNNVEETSDQKETVLYQAVREKDFGLAATKKHELEQMQMDDALAVLQVNAAFYRSFSQRDTKLDLGGGRKFHLYQSIFTTAHWRLRHIRGVGTNVRLVRHY
jgi:hypothetical protein